MFMKCIFLKRWDFDKSSIDRSIDRSVGRSADRLLDLLLLVFRFVCRLYLIFVTLFDIISKSQWGIWLMENLLEICLLWDLPISRHRNTFLTLWSLLLLRLIEYYKRNMIIVILLWENSFCRKIHTRKWFLDLNNTHGILWTLKILDYLDLVKNKRRTRFG